MANYSNVEVGQSPTYQTVMTNSVKINTILLTWQNIFIPKRIQIIFKII